MLRRTVTLEELAADVLSQIKDEPEIADWDRQDYADACLAYLGVAYLPESWVLELVDEIYKLRVNAMRIEVVDLGAHTLTVFSPESL